uniref:HECT-type E3 ubiquitin transferase n=1 Tax=Aplanochytrium stocchinoi TaxID=215587 RepID=A0A7S3PFX2_9STRA|mmetsp:Transcript_5970/g.7112  ORF Transcript_5970/g.7112 Transcript_5970/m.7112 type:complete len:628 (+) Transcript_5970:250-2133(+)
MGSTGSKINRGRAGVSDQAQAQIIDIHSAPILSRGPSAQFWSQLGGGEAYGDKVTREKFIAKALHTQANEQWLRNAQPDRTLGWVRLLSEEKFSEMQGLDMECQKSIENTVDTVPKDILIEKLRILGQQPAEIADLGSLQDMMIGCKSSLQNLSEEELTILLGVTAADFSTCTTKQELIDRLAAVAWFGEGKFSDGFVRVFIGGDSLDLVPASKFSLDIEYKKYKISTDEIEVMSSKPFREKVKWFRGKCMEAKLRYEDGHVHIKVRREHLLDDSFGVFNKLNSKDLHKYFKFEFQGEEGQDAGGVAREWFELIAEKCFNVNIGLFEYSGVDNICYQINPSSYLAQDRDDEYFRFFGRIIGKALFESQTIKAHLTQPYYKHILGWPISIEDIEHVNPEYFGNMRRLQEIDDIESLYLDFTTTIEVFGEKQIVPLKPNGEEIDVTKRNLQEYIQLSMKHIMIDRIRYQLSQTLNGIYEVIPEIWLSIFDYRELELLMCGLPMIDVVSWKENTIYLGNYEKKGEKHKVVRWFWEVIEAASPIQRARFLQFCTGSSRVPIQGFGGLQGYDGNVRLFSIQSIDKKDSVFPRAHTCFNRVDLPEYSSRQELVQFMGQTLNIHEDFMNFKGME